MRQVAARVKHPCFGVRVASVHKINRLHLENVACRGEKLLFEKTVFKTFCGEKDDKYVKTPRKSAVFSVLHLSSTHFGACGRTRTGDLRITNALLYQLSHTSSYLLPERVFSRSQCSQYIMLLKVRQYFFEIFLDILRVSVIMV